MLARRIHEKMTVTLRTAEGHQFKGEFGNPNGFPRPRREVQNLPYQALAVSRNSIAKEGDLVHYKGTKFLLCGQHHLTKVKLFLALEVQDHVTLTRMEEGIDPVIGVKRGSHPVTLVTDLPSILDPTTSLEEMKFQKPTYRFLTNFDIKPGDMINGTMQILMVSNLLGLKVAEVA